MLTEVSRSLRHVARARGFFAVSVLTLAVAIGGAGGLFSLVDAVILRSLPVREPSRLVAAFPANGEALFGVTMPTLAAFAERQQSLAGLCGVSQSGAMTIELQGANVLRPIESVTGECATVLGLAPAAGRLISNQDAPVIGAGAPVAVISYRLWHDVYGGDAASIGRTLRIEGQPLTIVGVLPQNYRGLNADEAPDVVLPLSTMWQLRGGRVLALHMLGRLRDDVTLEAARTELRTAWVAAWAATNPAGIPPAAARAGLADNFRVDSLQHGFSTLRYRFAQPLIAAIALAVALLLLAAVNVGALQLSRTVERESQIAVQLALGASRGRLAVGLFTEGFTIAISAAVVALPIAWVASQFVASVAWTGSRALTMRVTPEWPVYAAIAATALVTGITISLAPIVLIRLQEFQLAATRQIFAATRWWRRVLVVTQVALSFGLLFGATLLATNFLGLRTRDVGYDDTELRWTRLEPIFGAPRTYDAESYLRTVQDRMAALPGVERAAMAIGFPTTEVRFTTAQFPIEPVGANASRGDTRGMMDRVSPGFFATAGVPVLQGREFEWSDTSTSAAVAVITLPLADKLFPEGNAVGRQIRVPGRKPSDLTIVGVAADFSPGDPRIIAVPRIYVPMAQEPQSGVAPVILLRTTRDGALLEQMRAAIADFGRHQISSVRTIQDQKDRLLTQERLLSTIATSFATLGAVLGALGLYALLAHTIMRRTRELGVRMALGATRRSVQALVAQESFMLVLSGTAAGVPLALIAGRWVGTLLFDISPTDGWLLATTGAGMLIIAIAAAAIPAYRAARVEPATALRTE